MAAATRWCGCALRDRAAAAGPRFAGRGTMIRARHSVQGPTTNQRKSKKMKCGIAIGAVALAVAVCGPVTLTQANAGTGLRSDTAAITDVSAKKRKHHH